MTRLRLHLAEWVLNNILPAIEVDGFFGTGLGLGLHTRETARH